MKEELQGKLVEILTSIQTAAGKASDFAMEQLPDVAQSYVVYGRFTNTVEFAAAVLVLSLGMGLALFAATRTSWVETEGYSKGDWQGPRIASLMAGLGVSIIGIAGVCSSFGEFAMVWFAPKVWLLKEIAGLVR